MGIYYAVADYSTREVIRPPGSWSEKWPGIIFPGHPLSVMMLLANERGHDFVLINDMTHEKAYHGFKNVTEMWYRELLEIFPEYGLAPDDGPAQLPP